MKEITQAAAVVTRWFFNPPMISLLLVNIIKGTSAKAMPKDSTTWLATRAFVALTPERMIASGGIIVMARLRYRLMLFLIKPCMTTSPDIVPTDELESPAIRRPRPNRIAVKGPSVEPSSLNMTVKSSMRMSRSKNRAAAMTSMLMLMAPAMIIARTISMNSKRKICFFSFSVLPTTRLFVSAECR